MKKYIELTEYDSDGRIVVFADSIQGLCHAHDHEYHKDFTEVMVSGYTFMVNETIDEILEKIERENDMIPMSVIEDIKSDIEHEGDMYPNGDWYISSDRVCEIIDKHTSRKEQDE